MGCIVSTDDKKVNIRVLVLGTAGCGKSTFARQMKILYCNGFSDDEIFNYKTILVQNLLLGIRDLINLCSEDRSIDLDKHKKLVKFFRRINPYTSQLDDEVLQKVKSLWKDTEIITTGTKLSKKSEYTESLNYVLKNLDRIAKGDWTPTNEDILHVRQRTTGIVETNFEAGKNHWTLIDVGGQKVERRKWIHSQQNLNAMIYFVSMDEYDVQNEEAGKSGIEESLEVWKETINSDVSERNFPVILFLNKRDLLEEKLKKTPLKKVYKDYKGKTTESAIEYIKNLFIETANIDKERIYSHPTCAIDTNQMSVVFNSVMDFIYRERLRYSGI